MFPQGFINKTLELIIDHGPMPFHAPGGPQQQAHPLTNSHRDVLRMLQKQGAVKIEYEGDELVVSYSGPPVPDKMFAALRSLPDRAIYVVPSEERRQKARDYIRQAREAGLWTGARVHVIKMGTFVEAPVLDEITGKIVTRRLPVGEGAKFMTRLMAFHRPILRDHRCIMSAASTVNLRNFQDGTPAAYGEDGIVPARKGGFWKYGDPDRFHRPPIARPVSREEYMMARQMERVRQRPRDAFPRDEWLP